MNDEFKYPCRDAARNILRKLGVEPESRFGKGDQDFEYTACEMEELGQYVSLYNRNDTALLEKRVLGCFFMEGLNDYVSTNDSKHPLQDEILTILHRDIKIHHYELDYRTDTEGRKEGEWWPICKYILEWRRL